VEPNISTFKTPGHLIEALLKERGWTKKVLAIVLEIDEATVTRLVSAKLGLSADRAVALEEVFGVPAEKFLELQKSYELAQARIAARPDARRAVRASVFGSLPVAELIRRGWLKNVEDQKNIPQVEAALAEFFGVASSAEIQALPHAAKKTDVGQGPTLAQLAWIHRVRTIAADMLVPRYTPFAFNGIVEKLKPLLSAAEETRKVPRVLAEGGIRFVIVESLPTAKIDGVCLWLDEHSPVIGMSLRLDRVDNFWFVLRHELEHVKNRDGFEAPLLDAELEGDRAGVGTEIPEPERVANAAAADFTVPRKHMDAFVARKAPFFAERDLLGFAKTLGVHPGIVAGQLQHRTKRYEIFRAHLVKVRASVAPSAIVDGWGDIAPVGE
jgi:HTH-type transcriptional regulator/antitoxin HigA